MGRPAVRDLKPTRAARAGAPTTIARSSRTPTRWERRHAEDEGEENGGGTWPASRRSTGRETGARGQGRFRTSRRGRRAAAAAAREPGGKTQAGGQGTVARRWLRWSGRDHRLRRAPDGAVDASQKGTLDGLMANESERQGAGSAGGLGIVGGAAGTEEGAMASAPARRRPPRPLAPWWCKIRQRNAPRRRHRRLRRRRLRR